MSPSSDPAICDPVVSAALPSDDPAACGGGAPQTSCDAFWGGQVVLSQPRKGFRAGTASVLLAAWLEPQTRGLVVDLGAGVGSVGLMAAKRLPAIQVLGLERDPDMAALGQSNARGLGLEQRVRLQALDVFDAARLAASCTEPAAALVCNPPFTQQGHGRPAQDDYRAAAHQSPWRLEDWMGVAKRCVRAGGWLYWVLPASQLQSALAAAARLDMGAAKVLPVQSFADRPARLILLALRKNRRGDSQILPPLVLYDAPGQHSETARAILQDGRGIWEAGLGGRQT